MINQLFDETMKQYRITGKRLSEVTGVSPANISGFRNGKVNPPTDTLMRLLEGLATIEPESKVYFCQLLAGSSFAYRVPTGVSEMDRSELARLLFAVADKLKGMEELAPQRTPVSA